MPHFLNADDVLAKSSILRQAHVRREFFDPTNQAHLSSLEHFVRTGNWGDVQFYCEHPFTDVPMTVLMKFAGHGLSTVRETVEERNARIGAMRLTVPDEEPQRQAA